MKPAMIDTSKIQSMLAQLKAVATRAQDDVPSVGAEKPAERLDFAAALKSSLDQVNGAQARSQEMTRRFAAGDENVNLSDVMISMQKSSIAFQATVQARNKLVSAYQDIMNMQV